METQHLYNQFMQMNQQMMGQMNANVNGNNAAAAQIQQNILQNPQNLNQTNVYQSQPQPPAYNDQVNTSGPVRRKKKPCCTIQ